MSAENQESKPYPVDAIHYYPKDKRLVIEVEGGVSFALTQTPEGLFAQLLLNQAASQRAAVFHDDVVPATEKAAAASPTSPEPAAAVSAETASAQPEARCCRVQEGREPVPPDRQAQVQTSGRPARRKRHTNSLGSLGRPPGRGKRRGMDALQQFPESHSQDSFIFKHR